jgi:hypothetical protein
MHDGRSVDTHLGRCYGRIFRQIPPYDDTTSTLILRVNHRLRSIWSLVLVLLALVAATTTSAAPPRALGLDITSARELDDSQIKRVKSYATYWVEQLATQTADPAQRATIVETAREELIEPLGPLKNPSESFRYEYGQTVLQAMQQQNVLEGNDAHRSVNAILVLTELGTGKALRELYRMSNQRTEPRSYIRQRAAIGCMVILSGATGQPQQLIIEKRDIDSAVRALRDAAIREPQPVVVRRQLEAILVVDDPKAREHLVQALNAIVTRLAQEKQAPSPLIEPLHVAVLRLRDQFLNLSGADQRELGTAIGPCLGELLDAIDGQWQIAQNENGAKVTYSEIIELCEIFLRRIHAQIRNGSGVPTGDLKQAWDNGDQPQYRADLNAWMEQLSQPPYK